MTHEQRMTISGWIGVLTATVFVLRLEKSTIPNTSADQLEETLAEMHKLLEEDKS